MKTEFDHCPLCNGDPEPSVDLRVCIGCHESLQMSGAVAVSTTGEFAAMPGSQASRILATPPPVNLGEAATDSSCSWCNKSRGQVQKLLTRGDTNICNECVAFCVDILELEFGESWK